MQDMNVVINRDCAEGLKELPDNFVDLTVTSPPYDNLRYYKGFTFDFPTTALQLYRVTKEGGVVVWVVGDQTIDGGESGTSFRQALYFQSVGFRIYDTMIYEKAGVIPSSVRYTQAFEYMFVLSKGKPKTINLIRDRKNRWAGQTTFGKPSYRQKDGSLVQDKEKAVVAEVGKRYNIWRYANGFGFGQKDPLAYKHPATFPEKLAEDHILSWSNEGDLVLDPFMGSGTVAVMSKKNGRNYLGFEISTEYCDLIADRLALRFSPVRK